MDDTAMEELKKLAKFRTELYRDRKKEYRWRIIRNRGGKIIAESGEGYATRAGAKRALRAFRENHWAIDIAVRDFIDLDKK